MLSGEKENKWSVGEIIEIHLKYNLMSDFATAKDTVYALGNAMTDLKDF